eukprot:3308445-Prymnesium_polylepis.2
MWRKRSPRRDLHITALRPGPGSKRRRASAQARWSEHCGPPGVDTHTLSRPLLSSFIDIVLVLGVHPRMPATTRSTCHRSHEPACSWNYRSSRAPHACPLSARRIRCTDATGPAGCGHNLMASFCASGPGKLIRNLLPHTISLLLAGGEVAVPPM